MTKTHTFRARLRWNAEAAGSESGNHVVELEGKPALDVSSAPQYRGDPGLANPEELLLAALTSCQMLTYRALAARAGIGLVAYTDEAEAVLSMADRRMRVTEVILRPRIELAPGADVARARELVDRAHEGCFIANSVSCAIRIEPEIVEDARGGRITRDA